jgi:hypothetical protein
MLLLLLLLLLLLAASQGLPLLQLADESSSSGDSIPPVGLFVHSQLAWLLQGPQPLLTGEPHGRQRSTAAAAAAVAACTCRTGCTPQVAILTSSYCLLPLLQLAAASVL